MMNDIVDFEWRIPDVVRVDSETIDTINTGGMKYRPFDRFYEDREFRLYIEFSKVETPKDTEKFISSYGVLGLDILNTADKLSHAENAIKKTMNKLSGLTDIVDSGITQENISQIHQILADGYQPLIDYISLSSADADYKKRLKSRSESTEEFLVEAKLMRYLLWLNSINFEEYQDLKLIKNTMLEAAKLVEPKDQSKELYGRGIEFSSQYEDCEGLTKSRLLEWEVKAFVASAVSLQLETTSPSIGAVYNKTDLNYEHVMSYRPKNLFGALYLMFTLDLLVGNRMILCPICQQPLLLVDKRDKQCHKKCTSRLNTQLSRERERRAKELCKAGKSVSEIHQIIKQGSKNNDIKIEQIEKWIKEYKNKNGGEFK
jgi:hypothetical protein